jgi:hypothetical protein
MFRSEREKLITQGRTAAIDEARKVIAALDNNEEADLSALQKLVEEINHCHKNVCNRRKCFKCGEKFLPEESHAEILISYCKDPNGKIVVAGYHEQHYLTPCKKCYEELELENHWQQFKPEPIPHVDKNVGLPDYIGDTDESIKSSKEYQPGLEHYVLGFTVTRLSSLEALGQLGSFLLALLARIAFI